MDNIQELYSMIMGRDASQFENDPEVRHISFYLCELLFKEYSEIETEAKEVHKEDQNARASLHRLVDDCTPSALRNIQDISDTVEELSGISNPASEIRKLSQKCDAYAKDITKRSSDILKELHSYYELQSDNDFLSSVNSLCDEILHAGEETVPLLIAYEELLEEVAKLKNSSTINVLRDNVKRLKIKIEQGLYKSFSNNINVTLKVVSDIRMLGLSSEKQIAMGFIKHRSQYVSECFEAIQASAKENIHRGINELTLALKTKVYSILLCYKNIFGDVDELVTTFVRKTVFQFLQFVSYAIRGDDRHKLTSKHIAELERELQEISQSFTTFGFSFTPFLREIFHAAPKAEANV